MKVYRAIAKNKNRASFLVKSNEVVKVGDVILSICGDYRMTAHKGEKTSGKNREPMGKGLFYEHSYSFRELKRKTI